MKQVRIIAFTLVMLFMLSIVFAGCGTQTGDNQTETKASVAQTTQKSTEQKVTEEAAKPVKVTWYAFGDKQPDHEKVIASLNKDLIEKINVELDLQVINSGVFDDKMRMIIDSKDDYDICFTANWKNNYRNNVSIGAFKELDGLINDYAPKLKEYLPDFLFDAARVKGKLYAVPNQQIIYSSWGVYAQKELLDKYKFDLKSVKSFKDLEPFLESIKNNEPNLIPYRVNGMPSFQYESLTNFASIERGDKTLKVVASVGSKAEKDTLDTYFKGWFDKGYIRKDVLTVTDDSAELKANKYAVNPGTVKPGGDASFSKQYGKEYVSVGIEKPYIGASAGTSTMNAISITSKNPDKAIKLIELINMDKDIYNKLLFGLENDHYKKTTSDTVDVPDDSKYKMGNNAWMFGNQFNAYYMKGQQPGTWEETDRLNRSSDVSVIRGFTLDQAPIQAELAKLTAVADEYRGMYYMADFEKRYQEYVDKMKTAGLDTVVSNIQEQVDKWAKENGKK